MTSSEPCYPYLLEPKETPAIWGGDALVARYGKHAAPGSLIGESWECWDANRVANGAFAGATLAGLRSSLGARLMGTLDPAAMFPILTKLIDARQPLSVQVHPDDAYARRIEGQPNGKTECWFILEAQPGAEIVLGWTRATERAEFERRVADGSLGDILRRVPVQAGDVFYLPAGTVHAIGAGIVLFEVQQASDLTYRIFDWNRVGADGKSRELHVAKAADVLDFSAAQPTAVQPLVFGDGDVKRRLLIADSRFLVERVTFGIRGGSLATDGLPLAVMAVGSPLRVQADRATLELAPYATALTPASVASLAFSGGDALVARPQPNLASVTRAARDAFVPQKEIDAFLRQFV